MRAALHLMSAKGMDGVAIQDIANAAHVGFGSFYNYFPSKEAIFQTLKDELIEHDAAALDKLGEQVTDPAEKIAASARYTIRHGRANSVWGKFVLATNFNMAMGSTILGGLMAEVTMSEQADDPFGSPDDLPEKSVSHLADGAGAALVGSLGDCQSPAARG
jgi:AcrR family transcriptional regulator